MGKIKKNKLISANCRGLADKSKRNQVMNLFRKKSYSIICLQDIHIAMEESNKMRNEWGIKRERWACQHGLQT